MKNVRPGMYEYQLERYTICMYAIKLSVSLFIFMAIIFHIFPIDLNLSAISFREIFSCLSINFAEKKMC